ncbi:hypothetical protein MLD38_009681 [Melastoma candidum]|nr:hypothetical protein MLD38_009681 [Melastoma candidum]
MPHPRASFKDLPTSWLIGLAVGCIVLSEWRTSSSALILSLKKHHGSSSLDRRPPFRANHSGCSLFEGTWVRDDSYPLYQYSECPFIDPEFNCQMYGRPDSGYQRYRWSPLNCNLPR